MITSVNTFDIPLNALNINKDIILSAMGYDINAHINIPEILNAELQKLIVEVDFHVDIKAGFRLFSKSDIQITKTGILIKDVLIQSGNIINSQLKNSETILIFVCSLGKKFDTWMDKFKSSTDMFSAYIADSLGSELVELATDLLENKIEKHCSSQNLKNTNRFSPGYCGWPLSDQHKLFSFLPENYCGIQLNNASLMTPIKSVSGIYGLGESVKKETYRCSICNLKDCFKRQHQL